MLSSGGLRPAVVSASAAVAGDNVLLQEPIGQPAITGVRDLIDLTLFVIVAVTVGWLVAKARADRFRAEKAAEQERRAKETRDRLIATISHDLATPLIAFERRTDAPRQAVSRPIGDRWLDRGEGRDVHGNRFSMAA